MANSANEMLAYYAIDDIEAICVTAWEIPQYSRNEAILSKDTSVFDKIY